MLFLLYNLLCHFSAIQPSLRCCNLAIVLSNIDERLNKEGEIHKIFLFSSSISNPLFFQFPQVVSDAMLAELKQCFLEAYDDNKDGKIDIREVSHHYSYFLLTIKKLPLYSCLCQGDLPNQKKSFLKEWNFSLVFVSVANYRHGIHFSST